MTWSTMPPGDGPERSDDADADTDPGHERPVFFGATPPAAGPPPATPPPAGPPPPTSPVPGPAFPGYGAQPPRRSRAIVAVVAAVLAGCAALVVAGIDLWAQSGGLSGSGSSRSVFAPSAQSASPTGRGTQNGELDSSAISAKVDPAVVDITTTLSGGRGVAAGTGMVLTSSGEVLTNNHVIEDAGSISVKIGGSDADHKAEVIGYDVADDVALLKVDGVSGLKTVSLADSSRVSVNDQVVAIGNALGRGGTPVATSGSVAALDQTITVADETGANTQTLKGLIQMNAALQPGDSGGPLVDGNAQVVGMDTAAGGGRFRQESASDLGFAIPINTAVSIAHQIESGHESGNVHVGSRGLLGLEVQDLGTQGQNGPDSPFPRRRAPSDAAPVSSGALVAGVESGSPADSAGLASGDVIVSLAGKTIGSTADLNSAMAPYHPGDDVEIGWVSGSGQHHSAKITLASGPPA